MRLRSDVHKQLEEALGDIDANAIGMVVRNGRFVLSAFGPAELAQRAGAEIKSELAWAHRLIMVAVQSGWVTLEGEVDWNYQKNGAETAVRRIPWVKGITNDLRVHASLEPAEVSCRVWAEFRVRAELRSDAKLRCWASTASITG